MSKSIPLKPFLIIVALLFLITLACDTTNPPVESEPISVASPSSVTTAAAQAAPKPTPISKAPPLNTRTDDAQATAKPTPISKAAPSKTTTDTARLPQTGGILKRTHPTDPAGFDPVQDSSINTVFLIAPIYSQLLRFSTSEDDNPGSNHLVPELAKEWKLDQGGKRLQFLLRDDVLWHDAEPLDSEDILTHFNRVISPPKGLFSSEKSPFLHVSSISAPDPHTVVFDTEFATSCFLESFGAGHYMIVAKHVMERETQEDPRGLRKNAEALIGTGPFVFDSYEPGVAFRVRRNPHYWDAGKPYLDGIDFLVIRDPAMRFAALVAGQVHMSAHGSPSLTATQAAEIRQKHSDNITLERVRGPFWLGALFNSTREPFDNRLVRQALNLAVDRQAYLNTVTGGEDGIGILGGFTPPGTEFALRDEILTTLDGYRQPKQNDMVKARDLLNQAGFPDGLQTSITVRGDVPLWVDAALFFQSQWKDLGVDVQIDTVEFGSSIQRMLKGDFDIRLGGIASNLTNPDRVLYASFHSQGPNGLYYPEDTELDALLEGQRRETNPERRADLSNQAETRLIEKIVPGVVGHYSMYYYGSRKEVSGWRARDYMLYNQYRMDNVWLTR